MKKSINSNVVVWYGRILLTITTILFLFIASRTLAGNAKANGILLSTPTAVTIVRLNLGGTPLILAVTLFTCLISEKRLLSGLAFLATADGILTILRAYGIITDESTPLNVRILIIETLILVLTSVGIFLEMQRQRNLNQA